MSFKVLEKFEVFTSSDMNFLLTQDDPSSKNGTFFPYNVSMKQIKVFDIRAYLGFVFAHKGLHMRGSKALQCDYEL